MSQLSRRPVHARLLRTALWANCAFSASSGLISLLATSRIAAVLGVSFQLPLQLIGAGLLLFAADLGHQATRPRLSPTRATLTSLSDFGWVAGTVVVLIGWGGELARGGVWLLLAVAAVVALFGAIQLVGVRRIEGRDTVPA